MLAAAELVSDKLETFLIANNVKTPDRLGLLAASEQALEDKVFPMLKTAGVEVDKLDVMIGIKKAWLLSQGQVDKELPPPLAGSLHPLSPSL